MLKYVRRICQKLTVTDTFAAGYLILSHGEVYDSQLLECQRNGMLRLKKLGLVNRDGVNRPWRKSCRRESLLGWLEGEARRLGYDLNTYKPASLDEVITSLPQFAREPEELKMMRYLNS